MPWLQMSDSARKVSIVASTALLPRPLRVAARERLLAQHELDKCLSSGLIIIGHPKSGNTWLKAMISRLYQVRHGLRENQLIGSDELARVDAQIPVLAATNGYYSYEGIIGEKLDARNPDPVLRKQPTVVLLRDPRDIAVSWYFQFTERQSARKQELINHFIEHPIDRKTVEMWEFVRHSDIGLPCLIEYCNTWERNLAGMENGILVKYEELRVDPAATMRRIVDCMGETFTDDEIAECVRFGSFDNLRKLEGSGFFRGGGMSRRRGDKPESRKVRRAKVGGYADYFTPEQIAELDELVAKNLSPSLGYGPTPAVEEGGGDSQ